MKKSPLLFVFVSAMVLVFVASIVRAQFSGSRGGVESTSVQHDRTPRAFDESVQQYITVEATIASRVTPDQIRIVLAIGDRAETPQACEHKLFTRVAELRDALKGKGIAKENIVDDFIAVLPEYRFEVEVRNEKSFAVEKKSGYQMQSNVHIRVDTDDQAMMAIRTAFALGISDVIAFDYWSSDLDSAKQSALESAMAKAKTKSQFLLTSIFKEVPEPVNVRSSTRLVLPDSLYSSFENVNVETYSRGWRGNDQIPVIRTFRPKNTYYKGYFDRFADQQPTSLPMRSEITVVSTVTLFFASPAKGLLVEENVAGSDRQ